MLKRVTGRLRHLFEKPQRPGPSARADDWIAYAAKRRLDALRAVREMSDDALPTLLDLLRSREPHGLCYAAMDVLAGLGQPALTHVLPLLEHPSSDIASSAAGVLYRMPRETVVPLLGPLLRHSNPQVVHRAAGLAQHFAENESWVKDELLALVKSERYPTELLTTVERYSWPLHEIVWSFHLSLPEQERVLARMRALRDDPAIVAVLTSDDVGEPFWAAAKEAASTSDHAEIVLPKVTPLLKSWRRGRRLAALRVIADYGPPASGLAPDLIPLLAGADSPVTRETKLALSMLGPDALPVLFEHLRNSRRVEVRRRVVAILGGILDGSHAPDVVRKMRHHATRMTEARPAIIDALKTAAIHDRNSQIRMCAEWAMCVEDAGPARLEAQLTTRDRRSWWPWNRNDTRNLASIAHTAASVLIDASEAQRHECLWLLDEHGFPLKEVEDQLAELMKFYEQNGAIAALERAESVLAFIRAAHG